MASSLEVSFAGHTLVLDADLALYWPAQKMLVVSDLHLEKSTFLAQFGSAVAPYDTVDTLDRLVRLIARYRPRTLLLLGDTFHDRFAWERLQDATRAQLLAICASVGHCCFVEGNHDLGVALDPSLCFVDDYIRDGILFSHEPALPMMPQVVGHFHPKLRASLRGHRLSGKCFAVNEHLLIMPAFGSFTGGLDLSDEVFVRLAGVSSFQPFLVYKSEIVRVTRQTAPRD